jgi:hypothetical protein
MGYYLNLAKSALGHSSPEEPEPCTRPAEHLAAVNRLPGTAIPCGVVMIAPRYDGFGKPLAEVPQCWCCEEPWELEELRELKGQAYAFLKPGCACLDNGMCYRCFVCREHCCCPSSQPSAMEQELFR